MVTGAMLLEAFKREGPTPASWEGLLMFAETYEIAARLTNKQETENVRKFAEQLMFHPRARMQNTSSPTYDWWRRFYKAEGMH